MQETFNNNHLDNLHSELDLLEIFSVLFRGKWKIISLTAFISIIGVVYSLSLPNIYVSKTILAPANASSGISGALGRYAGLAGFAGLAVPSAGGESNSAKATLKIKSLNFFENNILPNIFLPDLMAVESWSLPNSLVYDESIYNNNTNTWIVDPSNPNKKEPSAQSSFSRFIGNHLNLSQDKKNGFITLTIKHQSPFLAKEWAELVVDQINTLYRKKDKSESEKAVRYLNQKIEITNLSETKEAIAELLKEETKKLALIEAKQSYVFDYVDPPSVMETKSEPDRAFICILFALIGGMLSVLLVLIEHYFFKKTKE